MRRITLFLVLLVAVPVGSDQSVARALPQTASTTITVSVRPQKSTLYAGETQIFVGTVAGSSDKGVTWSIAEEGGGTVSSRGLYTAPKVQGIYHVRAASTVDPKKMAIATVTVLAYCDPPAFIAR